MIDLEVRLFDRFVGNLFLVGEDEAPEDWRFKYSPEYITPDTPTALSVSMPIRVEVYEGARVRNWFCNLLPEGLVRESITKRLRIDSRDDFGLLARIGGECAGAVSIIDPQSPKVAQFGDGEDLERLLLETGTAADGNWALFATPHRLSLAGAQDKLAVILEPNGRLRLPNSSEPSTHILKPDSRNIPGLCDLEAFGLALARSVGLNACLSDPITIAGRKALLVQRYDRVVKNGITTRLHQEDFCQALGYPGELKYESQFGPSLKRCSQLIRDMAFGPEAVQGFLSWVAFNVILGNADAHAKNLALLYDPYGSQTLAPFYDLVPTIAIDEYHLDRTPALNIGAASRIDDVKPMDLKAFASNAGYAPSFVINRVRALAEAVMGSISSVVNGLEDQGADGNNLKRAARIVGENTSRILRTLG